MKYEFHMVIKFENEFRFVLLPAISNATSPTLIFSSNLIYLFSLVKTIFCFT